MSDLLADDGQPEPSARRLVVAPELAGTRLDLFLAAELSLSRGQARRLLERGAVRLDGRPLSLADKGLALPAEGAITVAPYRAEKDERAAPPGSRARSAPRIVAAGEGWLAVDKPAGMPVHPLRADEPDTLLGHLLLSHPEMQGVGEGGLRSGIVHRLDVDTSGVLLLATTQPRWERLRAAFQAHRVAKRYRALVEGELELPRGGLELELPLVVARHRPALVRVASEQECARGRARPVQQRVIGLAVLDGVTLVEVRPRTGFLHQIRATLAHLGHPLLGDPRYGAAAGRAGARRHMLHAVQIAVDDVEASAPEPADFLACLRAVGGDETLLDGG